MKKEKRNLNKFYRIGFFSIFTILIIAIALPLLMPYKESTPSETAMLVPYTLNYFLNDAVEDEIVFYVSMANYGFADATNVEVTCELFEQEIDGSLIDNNADYATSKTFDMINKTSTEELTVTGLGISKVNQESPYIGLCKVSYCENCEVLSNRLSN